MVQKRGTRLITVWVWWCEQGPFCRQTEIAKCAVILKTELIPDMWPTHDKTAGKSGFLFGTGAWNSVHGLISVNTSIPDSGSLPESAWSGVFMQDLRLLERGAREMWTPAFCVGCSVMSLVKAYLSPSYLFIKLWPYKLKIRLRWHLH